MMIKCYGCLAEFQKTTDDPVPVPHLYIGAITECWNVFGEVLMKEYSNPEYFKVHRLTVDAYGAQHIGNQEDRRARQSANIHLIALYLTLVQKASEEEVLKFLRKATNVKKDWPSLFQRKQAYWLTNPRYCQRRQSIVTCGFGHKMGPEYLGGLWKIVI